jgi:hypothetical protein
MNIAIPAQTLPRWFWIVTLLGLAWNIFGLVQFVSSLSATQESLVAGGLSAEQASVMLGYPVWMTIAFAIGVVGGTLGCVLLALRRRLAVGVFAASLLGYIALWIGDAVHGVFAAMGAPQVIILSIVVAIALGLWLMARAFGPQF